VNTFTFILTKNLKILLGGVIEAKLLNLCSHGHLEIQLLKIHEEFSLTTDEQRTAFLSLSS